MKAIKQAIVVRKDLRLGKSELLAVAVKASINFLLENNESERVDELLVRLSHQELHWLKDSFQLSMSVVDSHDALSDIMFKAEIMGISVYSIAEKNPKNSEEKKLACIALGPDEEDLINQVIGNLKSA